MLVAVACEASNVKHGLAILEHAVRQEKLGCHKLANILSWLH
jgi:hypothetical protein